MGKLAKPQRSKKHKKIKAVDPFYHGARKDARQEGWNQKPRGYDQEIPRKLKQLGFMMDGVKTGRVGKKSKNKFLKHPDAPQKYNNQFSTPLGAKPSSRLKDTESDKKAPKTDTSKDISSMQQSKKSKKKGSVTKITEQAMNDYIDKLKPTRTFVEPFTFKKKVDETEAAFMRRVNNETNRVLTKSRIDDKFDVSDEKRLMTSLKAKKGMSEKKKKRLKDKKQKKSDAKKEKKREKTLDFDALQDKVEFGDVAHAPPMLSVRPKKAVETGVDRPGLRMPELKAAIANNMEDAVDSSGSKSGRSEGQKAGREGQLQKAVKRKALSAQQQSIADRQRQNFIDSYRQMKRQKNRDS